MSVLTGANFFDARYLCAHCAKVYRPWLACGTAPGAAPCRFGAARPIFVNTWAICDLAQAFLRF